mmetsp:Transcript_7991/g.32871  ORF Transcript_7991/g.32871 Transcript_7991/m.32871 type:complete len:273 (-) Transcript_7991:93-911(-)
MRSWNICACRFPPFPPAILWPDSATGTEDEPLPPPFRFSVIVGGASAISPKPGSPPREPSAFLAVPPCMKASSSCLANLAAFLASRLRSLKDMYFLFAFLPSSSSSPSTTGLPLRLHFFPLSSSSSSSRISPSPLSGPLFKSSSSSSSLDRAVTPASTLAFSDSMSVFKLSKPEKTRSCSSSETSSPCEMSRCLSRLACCFFVRLVASMNLLKDDGALSMSTFETWPSTSFIFGSLNVPVFLSNALAFSCSFWRRRAPLPFPAMPPMWRSDG